MRVPFVKTALAIVFVASMPFHAVAASGQKDMQTLEATAKSPSDHMKLAEYYSAQAQTAQTNLAEAQDLMKRWSSEELRTKVPNGYSHARSLVSKYTAELQHATQLAASHERTAKALLASNPSVSGQQTAMK